MDSSGWEELVEEGRRLAEAPPLDRWAVGDLALRAVRAGSTKPEKAEAQRKLAAFAESIGVGFAMVKDCWYTSAAWPPSSRIPDVSQAKHSKYRSRPNRLDLVLNDALDDGLTSEQLRNKVHRAEELLSDGAVRTALLDRSRKRSQRMTAAARAVENEEDLKARLWARTQQEQAKAELLGPGIQGALAERFIKANSTLARMVADLIDLLQVIDQTPALYKDRTLESLDQVVKAASRVGQELQPNEQEPQLRHVIDHDD